MLSTKDHDDQDHNPGKHHVDPLCRDCQINVYKSGNYGYMLKDRVWRQVDPEGTSMMCIPCVESCLGRVLRATEFKAPLTMVGYMLNPEIRKRLGGKLTAKGFRAIQTLYRGVPESLAFHEIAASILGVSSEAAILTECSAKRPTPYLGEETCWALWSHKNDPYALVLHLSFDGGRSGLHCEFLLAPDDLLRSGIAGVPFWVFVDASNPLLSRLAQSN